MKKKKTKTLWARDEIQFPRLLAELEATGAFTPDVMRGLSLEMDLTYDEISELIERAQTKWEKIKKCL